MTKNSSISLRSGRTVSIHRVPTSPLKPKPRQPTVHSHTLKRRKNRQSRSQRRKNPRHNGVPSKQHSHLFKPIFTEKPKSVEIFQETIKSHSLIHFQQAEADNHLFSSSLSSNSLCLPFLIPNSDISIQIHILNGVPLDIVMEPNMVHAFVTRNKNNRNVLVGIVHNVPKKDSVLEKDGKMVDEILKLFRKKKVHMLPDPKRITTDLRSKILAHNPHTDVLRLGITDRSSGTRHNLSKDKEGNWKKNKSNLRLHQGDWNNSFLDDSDMETFASASVSVAFYERVISERIVEILVKKGIGFPSNVKEALDEFLEQKDARSRIRKWGILNTPFQKSMVNVGYITNVPHVDHFDGEGFTTIAWRNCDNLSTSLEFPDLCLSIKHKISAGEFKFNSFAHHVVLDDENDIRCLENTSRRVAVLGVPFFKSEQDLLNGFCREHPNICIIFPTLAQYAKEHRSVGKVF